MSSDASSPPNLHPGLKFRFQTPAGWKELAIPAVLEGHHYYWVIRPLFNAADARNLGGPQGLPGKYRVVLTLAKPGYPLHPPGDHVHENALEGDSNLYVGRDFAKGHCLLLKFEERDLKVSLSANSQGRLGKLILEEMEAQSFDDARSLSWRVVSPTLSLLAANLDIPLKISQVDLFELRTGAVSGAILVDYTDVGLHFAPLGGMSEEFKHYVSMYREALNSSSPLYEFLCLFKIIESIIERRVRIARELKAKGESPTRLVERFPKLDELPAWLDSLLPETARRNWKATTLSDAFPQAASGRRFGYLIEKHLRPMRVRIAHALLESGELGFTLDEYDHLVAVERWLPLTKFVARRMLKNEFPQEFLCGVGDDAQSVQETWAEEVKKIWPEIFQGDTKGK